LTEDLFAARSGRLASIKVASTYLSRPPSSVVMVATGYGSRIRARISSTRQAVILGPSLTGLGKRPDLIPAHQVDLLTGMTAGIGGFALGLPRIWGSRTYPVSGNTLFLSIGPSRPVEVDGILDGPARKKLTATFFLSAYSSRRRASRSCRAS
jgi:hypothetical protein